MIQRNLGNFLFHRKCVGLAHVGKCTILRLLFAIQAKLAADLCHTPRIVLSLDRTVEHRVKSMMGLPEPGLCLLCAHDSWFSAI